jgi:acyl-CoA thioester hydrolase
MPSSRSGRRVSSSEDAPVLARAQFPLSYGDTDASGILYFGACFPWIERLSVGWLHENGIRFDQMVERFGLIGVTRATTCEYLSSAHVYDPIEVEMRAARVGATSYTLGFTVTRTSDAQVIARATITIAFADLSGRSTKIPDEIRALFETS